jgi:hypothetical protein
MFSRQRIFGPIARRGEIFQRVVIFDEDVHARQLIRRAGILCMLNRIIFSLPQGRSSLVLGGKPI